MLEAQGGHREQWVSPGTITGTGTRVRVRVLLGVSVFRWDGAQVGWEGCKGLQEGRLCHRM